MRLLLDLQACQTEASRGRGVGRYSEALARALAPLARDRGDDVRACLNGAFSDTAAPITDALASGLSPQRFSIYRYPSVAARPSGARTTACAVAEALVRRHWLALQPDVLHLAHLCEGYAGEAVVPQTLPQAPGLLRSATLYDLIPLRFPSHYLADPNFHSWYLRCIGLARRCDHLLAISESTRRDAIELLGIEPARITTIMGGADARFCPGPTDPRDAQAFRRRYGLAPRFVLYTGGDEYRKNLGGAMEAFAALPSSLRREVQLVLVCSLSEPTRHALAVSARRLGLGERDVLAVGHVPEDDLVMFYRLCDAFVFPSLYEGFGLPVLEAMRCGAPAIGGDHSSVREIIGHGEALFDARDPRSIARTLARVLDDAGFADALRRSGIERSRDFGWERSAQRALDALHEAWRRAQPTPASVGLLPPRRLAVFTPLPPARSGIADYSAALLPYLARHFDIDVYVDDGPVADAYVEANFRVRPHREFEPRRERYDAVIYEMGNSEFHVYMLPHLAREPGIVVLHDAYLSGLAGYLDFNLGHSGHYTRAMIEAHATQARRLLAPAFGERDPIGRAMVTLPCTREVLRQALGVVSHSAFNLDVAREHYPEGWAAPYRILPQVVRHAPRVDAERRRAARESLGLPADAFVVCSFGHVAWNKCGDTLLDAFTRLDSGPRPAQLVFAGELARDAFGRKLQDAIRSTGLGPRVRITGYLAEADYERHLDASDVAVQLRVHSRGGTPKGVLDCLARGLPVVVNDAASYRDYPEGVVAKIAAEPDAAELARVLGALAADEHARAAFGETGRAYVRDVHGPEHVAAQYALAIESFIQRGRPLRQDAVLREVGTLLADDTASDAGIGEIAACFEAQRAQPLFQRERLLVDVSHLAAADHGTGIPRVVRNTVKWLYGSRRAGVEVVAVQLIEGRLIEAQAWLAQEGLLAPGETATPPRVVVPRWGDRMLMLDSSWARIEEFVAVYDAVRRAGGKVYTVVYDLLPIQFPEHMVAGGPEWFRGWLARAVAVSDGLLCISRTVADDLAAEIEATGMHANKRLPIGYWHLGADFRNEAAAQAPTARVDAAMASSPLLMVGSIDPRKNHALVLDAFERLWAAGSDARLCIAGKPGWLVERLMARLAEHPENGRRLHYLAFPTDEELAFCYRRAAGLLFASAGEGFGLPVVEAARYGTPLLLSDIPVLREVAGEHASYLALGSAEALAAAIARWLAARAQGDVPGSAHMPCLTWAQSAHALLDVVLDGRWYRTVGGRTTTLPDAPCVGRANDGVS